MEQLRVKIGELFDLRVYYEAAARGSSDKEASIGSIGEFQISLEQQKQHREGTLQAAFLRLSQKLRVRRIMLTRTATAIETPFPVTASRSSKPIATAIPTKVDANGQPRKDVKVQLQYLKNDLLYDSVKPLQIVPEWADHEGRTNVQLESGPEEVITDVRGLGDSFTLDDNGFRYVYAPTKFKDWRSQPAIAKDFLPEMEELLKREVEGCDEVLFYDARIRQESEEGVKVQGLSLKPFARQVHLDNTESSVITKIRNLTEMKADYHLSGRTRIINLWRPIKHPVYDCGLAIADGGKLREGDIMECDRVRRDTGEFWDTMGVIKYRPGYDWFYMSLQDEANVLLFKNYDSATDVKARHCLHTAFDLPPEDVAADAPTRESIEVRALVFTHPTGVRRPSVQAMAHPLALSLEKGDLKLVDDEHSITDRLRTDIDEGSEVKDAVLLLRRQEIRRLENVRETLVTDRDQLQYDLKDARSELEHTRVQISIQTAHSDALQMKVQSLEQQLSLQHGDLHRQVHALSRELADARMYKQTRARTESDGLAVQGRDADARGTQNSETALLLERIERQEQEIQKWKAEAMGKGMEAVSRCWQSSVDEALRREREKDAYVIKALRKEIDRLKGDEVVSGGLTW